MSGDASQVAKIGTLGEAVVILSTTETTLLEADEVVAHLSPCCDVCIMQRVDQCVNYFVEPQSNNASVGGGSLLKL